MSMLCFFGRHRPSAASIAFSKRGGYTALCDACGVPIEQADKGPWRVVQPALQRAK